MNNTNTNMLKITIAVKNGNDVVCMLPLDLASDAIETMEDYKSSVVAPAMGVYRPLKAAGRATEFVVMEETNNATFAAIKAAWDADLAERRKAWAAKAAKREAASAKPAGKASDFAAMTTEALREECRKRGLAVSSRKGGKHCNWLPKSELIASLMTATKPAKPAPAKEAKPTAATKPAKGKAAVKDAINAAIAALTAAVNAL